MKRLLSLLMILVGLIHLLPVAGLAGADKLSTLYGVALSDPNLIILMRHRAVLFGILGVYLCLAAFRPAMQVGALCAGLASVVSFLVLAWTTGTYNLLLARVVAVDLAAFGCLIAAGMIYLMQRSLARKGTETSRT